ncbi:unnamed protein product [Sphagnum jensenii]|uniref:MnmC-like methyltransferase domain-containing protein n=1 Tax=Sphagnum jensenii TaxID=128206 RepID=A0ABP0V7V6_9BRYO
MHSTLGPDAEAQSIYIDQSNLKARLKLPIPDTLVLYDLGMGIATNSLAALELAKNALDSRPLHIVSFENDLEGLELALSSPMLFPRQAKSAEILRSLMKDHRWNSLDSKINWTLRLGCFEKQPLTEAPEIIFYDFYSPRSTPELWTYRHFHRLFRAANLNSTLPTILTTYSAATSARSALLLAGFHVGRGVSTSLKTETTVASTHFSEISQPLGLDWLEHLKRSSKAWPSDIEDQEEAFNRLILKVTATNPNKI